MIKLNEVIEANRILVSLGGEDQMQRIAAASIERSLELQNRIDRALAYASQTPPNSAHARQIARILDGSITVDDERNEVPEHDRPMPYLGADERHSQGQASLPAPVKRTRGPGKKRKSAARYESGLAGRTSTQRRAFREWMAENGYKVPSAGPVSPELVEIYDEAMEAERRQRAAQRAARAAVDESSEGQLPM
jgi:hypothetical protein